MWRLRAGWGYNIDDISHRLPMPKAWQRRICDWYEASCLGITPEELAIVAAGSDPC